MTDCQEYQAPRAEVASCFGEGLFCDSQNTGETFDPPIGYPGGTDWQ